MVYVRERFTGDGAGTESELVIRDGQGDDWVLAGSAGSWVDLAWSPGGKQLAAVELIYEAGPLLRPNQNVRAPLLYDLRSEEHTSELQSRGHLVCRLLLEKKKIKR